jgi:hypothetical protein
MRFADNPSYHPAVRPAFLGRHGYDGLMPETPSNPNILCALLLEAFPEPRRFPLDCWVRESLAVAHNGFADEIDVVTQGRARPDLIRRVADEHPIDGAHHPQYDERLRDAFREAQAFAWAAELAGLGVPSFVQAEGSPDLRLSSGLWIEAKAVHTSDDDNAAWRLAETRSRDSNVTARVEAVRDPAGGFLGKLNSLREKALNQWYRQADGGLVIFISVVDFDLEVNQANAETELRNWARDSAGRYDIRVVVCLRDGWRNPLIDTALNGDG